MKFNINSIFLTFFFIISIVSKNIHAASTSPSQVVPKVFEQIEKDKIKKGEKENLLKDLNNLQKETTSDLCFDTYFFWVFFSFSYIITNLFWISKKLEMFKPENEQRSNCFEVVSNLK